METKSTVGISPDFRYVLRVLALLAARDGIPLARVVEAYETTYRELVESGELSRVAAVREYHPGDLEFRNFSISSEGWEERIDPQGLRYLINPEGDVIESLEGPYAGQQYFAPDAAERELAKAGKKTMSAREWESFAHRYDDWMCANLPFAGIRFLSDGLSQSQGEEGFYRIVSFVEASGEFVRLSLPRGFAVSTNSQPLGLSVRCLKSE